MRQATQQSVAVLDFQEYQYRRWLREVDTLLFDASGITLADLPMIDLHGMWQGGKDAEDAAQVASNSIPW